ncbi:hypothetical protein D3C87_1418100 [compost metagenome]
MVDQFVINGIIENSIGGKVAALSVFSGSSKVIVTFNRGFFRHLSDFFRADIATERSHFKLLIPSFHEYQFKSAADHVGVGYLLTNLIWKGTGCDIEVFRMDAY